MDVALILARGRGQGRRLPVKGDLVTVGRREDCDLRIPLGDVSRKHCSILIEGDVVTVQDLGSSNGTRVNGKVVESCKLKAGDVLQIGSLLFVVQIDGDPTMDEARRKVDGDAEERPALPDARLLDPTAQADVADYKLPNA